MAVPHDPEFNGPKQHPPVPGGGAVVPSPSIQETKPSSQIDAAVLRTAGQRRVNILWEVTQALIAGGVVTTGLYVSARIALLALQKDETATGIAAGAFVFLTSSFSLVVGFYFGRTNHARTGGVGGETAGHDR